MGRHSTIPTLFDECKTVSITFLKKHGYLDGVGIKSGVLSWTRGGSTSGSISICVDLACGPKLTLNYTCNGERCCYTVRLTFKPSNLGKGHIWYFICPETNQLCRKLYQGNRYFLHRDAFKGCYYENQVQSHKNRELWKLYCLHFIPERVYEHMYKKYFKPRYNGTATRKMLRLQEKLSLYNNLKISIPSEEDLLMF
jgi:hypothetical protein